MKTLFPWLFPAVLLLIGLILWIFVVGHSFLGLVLCGVSGLICCYKLLSILHRSHGIAASILRSCLTCLIVLGLIACAITLVPIFQGGKGNPDAHCDYILVLGAKVNGISPSLTLQERIDAAYQYLTEHPEAVAVLSGGKGADEGISEAQCMFNELTAMGIPAERLWMESNSTSTQENLKYSLSLIEEKIGSKPQVLGLVTSEFHLFRAGLLAKDQGVTGVGIPAHTSWLTLKLNYYLREVAALWKYYIFGGYHYDRTDVCRIRLGADSHAAFHRLPLRLHRQGRRLGQRSF